MTEAYRIELEPVAGTVHGERHLARLLKAALRSYGLRCTSARYVARQGMTQHTTAQRMAELIVNGLIGWSGERGDVVVDSRQDQLARDRFIARAGDGDPENSALAASDLKRRLVAAIAAELDATAHKAAQPKQQPRKYMDRAAKTG